MERDNKFTQFISSLEQFLQNNSDTVKPQSDINLILNILKLSTDESQLLESLLYDDNVVRNRALKSAWMQGIYYKENAYLFPFGLHQEVQGCCGPLACIQAYTLKHLYFSANRSDVTDKKKHALIQALIDILKQASDNGSIKLLISDEQQIVQEIDSKEIISYDQLKVIEVESSQLLQVLLKYQEQYIGKNATYGLLKFTLSVVLTHGLIKTQNELPNYTNKKLLSEDGYCYQELVNLFMAGSAFNAPQCYTGKNGANAYEIGFLCTSKSALRAQPTLPIWIIFDQGHYSLLFSSQQFYDTLQPEKLPVTLMYYNQLENQEIIILELTEKIEQIKDEDEFLFPIEYVLRQKWGINLGVSYNFVQ